VNSTTNDGGDATGDGGMNVEQQRSDVSSPSRRDTPEEQSERNGRDERRDSLDSPPRRESRDKSPSRYSGHKRDRYGNHRGRNVDRDPYGRDSPSMRRRRSSPSPHDRRNSYRSYDRRPRRSSYDRDRRDEWNRDDRPTKSRRLNASGQAEQQMTYSQWCQQRSSSPGSDETPASVLQAEYDKYVQEKQLRTFFDHYKHTAWFKERYSSDALLESWKEKCVASKARAAEFLSKLDAGTLTCNYSAKDNAEIIAEHETEVSVAAQATAERQLFKQDRNKRDRRSSDEQGETDDSKQTQGDAKDDNEGVGATDEVSTKEDNATEETSRVKEAPKVIVCKSIPLSCSKSSLVNILNDVTGGTMEKFIISEPSPTGMDRTAWAIYDCNAAASSALDKHHRRNCDDFELVLAFHELPCNSKRVQFAHPFCNAVERMEKDYKQALRLMQRLDEDYGIEENPFGQEKENISKEPEQLEQELDLLIGYLRQVHGYCYYAGKEFADPDILVYQTGRAYLRPVQEEGETCTEGDETLDAMDKRIQQRSENAIKPDLFGSEALEVEKLEAFMKGHIIEETPGKKYRCVLCSKLFKGFSFVEKHIGIKHEHKVDQVKQEARDEQSFVNYKADADHLDKIVAARRRNDRRRNNDNWDDRTRRRSYDNRSGPRRRPRNRYRDHPYDPRDRPPPRGAGRDPRQVMSYVDLDEPKAQEVEIDYGALLSKHAASKKTSE